MSKRILSLLLCCAMILCSVTAVAQPVTDENAVEESVAETAAEETTAEETTAEETAEEETAEEETAEEETSTEETIGEEITEEETSDIESVVEEDVELFAAATWQEATQLVAGAKTAFNLPTYGSVAWFRIDVENYDEAIKLAFDGFDSTSNPIEYRLYKGTDLENYTNPSYIASENWFNTDLERAHKVTDAGSYYVKVELDNNNSVLENDINISYTIVAPDSYENNDTWQNAAELIQDVDSSYTLNGVNDVDWFKITVANDTDAIKLVMSNFDYTVNRISYYLYRGSDLEAGNNRALDSYSSFYTNMSRSYKVNEAGDYYVKVVMDDNYSEWNEKALKIRYEIVEGDANENNETEDAATYLTDSVPMEFTLTGHNDVDWFCFDTTMENETVTLTIEGFETDYSNAISITLYDNGVENTVFTAGTDRYYTRTASFINVGTKYIKISVNDDNRIAENPLKITYSGGTGNKDFNEANNTWQTATPLPKDTEVQFNLPAGTDTDWFVIDVDNPDEAIDLSISGFQPGSDRIWYTLWSGEELNKYGSNASALYRYGSFNTAHNYKRKITNPGKYYIKVILNDSNSSITDYLTIKYTTIAPDSYENNDTWKKATMLEKDVDTPFTLHGVSDVDWFKIKVDNPDETIQFNISGFKAGSSSVYCNLYSEEDFIREGDDAGSLDDIGGISTAQTRYYKITEPGMYYVKIGLYHYESYIIEPLSVSYNIIEPDEFENNDTWKKATVLQEGINKAFTLPGHNDVDWFKISANADEAIKLSFDGFETNGGRIYYSLYSAKDFETEGDYAASLTSRSSISSAYTESYKVKDSGEYYVKVGVSYYGSYGSVLKPITIKYDIQQPDEYENNDSYENAIPLTANKPVYHTFNGYNDDDYFRIDNVTVGDTINTYLTGYSGNDDSRGYIGIYYYDEEAEDYISVSGSTGFNDSWVHRTCMAEYDGTYYAVLSSAYTDCPDVGEKSLRYTISRDDAPVESIALNYSSITLNEGVTTTFAVDFEPVYATNQNLTWSTSDESVVSVDSYGNITCNAVGKATITVESEDGGYTSSCVVTVVPAVRVTGITLDKSETIVAYEGSIQLEATVGPEEATNQKVIWTSSDETVAVVSTKGKVTGVGHGDAVITATTEDGGFAATCSIHVPEYSTAVRSVAVNTNAATMYIGDDMQFEAVITPSNATNTNVTWESEDDSIVTIDANGKATAVGIGTTTITVTTEEGGYTNTCTVVVEPQPVKVTGISLSAEALTLAIPGTNTLVATIAPHDATDKTVKWTSSNPAVATVSTSGKVTAVGLGTATITAETQDGGYKAECVVTVSTTALSGDVNYDGDIDAADALLVLRSDVKLTTLTASQKKIADVNGDGAVDAADAILILKFNAGLIDSIE